jgi:hypothetical protein
MSLFEEIVKAWDAKDFDTLAAGMHEDFIWMDGYDVKTLDEWLPGLKHEMDSGFEFNKLSCLFENEDVIAYQHFVTDDNGISHRVTNVMLLKDRKVYRATVIRVPDN